MREARDNPSRAQSGISGLSTRRIADYASKMIRPAALAALLALPPSAFAGDIQASLEMVGKWSFRGGDPLTIFVTDNQQKLGFGFTCGRSSLRSVIVSDDAMREARPGSCTRELAHVYCGSEEQTIRYCLRDKQDLTDARQVQNEDAAKRAEDPKPADVDKAVISMIGRAKTACMVTIGNRPMSIPLDGMSLLRKYQEGCMANGSWVR